MTPAKSIYKLINILIISSFCLFLMNNTIFAQSLKKLHEKSFSVEFNENLDLEVTSGNVNVDVWDKNEVYVEVYGNRKAEDKIRFSFEQTDNGVEIIAKKKGSSFFNWFGIDNIDLKFILKIPSEFNAYINTSGGNVQLKGLTGEIEIKTSGGNVKTKNTEGDCYISTSGGNIELLYHTGKNNITTSGGNIELVDVTGDTEAETSGGDVVLEISDGKVYAGTSGGDVYLDYTGINYGVKLSTSGGDIDLILPDDFRADANLRTSGGDIDCDLPNTKTIKVTSSKFIAELGGGGKSLECKTSGGDITVRVK
ncbi:DUF4097 domain-containing protein [Bacteroidota bacterium]